MFNRFKGELDKRNINYALIAGSWEERFNKAVEVIDVIFEI